MSRALRRLVLTWGALALPLFVCAHNGEVLLAKLTLRADGANGKKSLPVDTVNSPSAARASSARSRML